MSGSQTTVPFDIDAWRRHNELTGRQSVTTPSSETSARSSGTRRSHQHAFSFELPEQDSIPVHPTLSCTTVSRNQLDQAISWARTSLRLTTGQIKELNSLSKDPPSVMAIKTHARILHLENLLERIIAAQPHFQVDSQLNSNVKGLVNKFICTDTIVSYKKHADDVIWSELKQANFGLDQKLFTQRACVREIKKCITHHLIQQRALLKTKLARSIESKLRIERVAQSLLNVFGMDNVRASFSLRCRFALMRCLLADMGKESRCFWDTVDNVMESLQADADREKVSISEGLRVYLSRDKSHFDCDEDVPVDLDEEELGSALVGEGSPVANGIDVEDEEDGIPGIPGIIGSEPRIRAVQDNITACRINVESYIWQT